MRIAARLAIHSAAPDRRRKDRAIVNAPATIVTPGFHGDDVVVIDLSEVGFQARVTSHIPPKSLVRLRVPGLGMVVARVVWSRNGGIGGEFVNPVGEGRLRLVPGYAPIAEARTA